MYGIDTPFYLLYVLSNNFPQDLRSVKALVAERLGYLGHGSSMLI